MVGLPQAAADRVLNLIDAGTNALENNDRVTAAHKYAEASALIFRQAAQCDSAEVKIQIAKRGQQLLQTAHSLCGKNEALRRDSVATCKQAGESNADGDDNGVAFPSLQTNIRFSDVAGLAEVKETLHLRLIYPLQHPEKLSKYGLQPGGGMLLYGPPGTGKTMIAKAVAGELALPFFAIKPAEILSKYFGESTQRLASLFDHARTFRSGAVIFVDEIDAIGGARSQDGSSEASRRLVTQLLQELDGVQGDDKGLLFLAATNVPWLLDNALLRPGRFDEKCYISLPDQEAREVLVGLQLKNCWLADDVQPDAIASATSGFSGADLMCLCERAKQIPFRDAVVRGNERPLQHADFEQSLKTVKPSVTAESLKRYEDYANS